MSKPQFHRLVVSEVRRETKDAVSVRFQVPENLTALYRFAPGQYLTLRLMLEGEELRRSYSICSGPEEGELRIAAKAVGSVSGWLNRSLKEGDLLDVMTPTGRFGVTHYPGDGRLHLGFAAGSGITPIISILRGILSGEPKSRFFLFYGNRSSGDILFKTALDDLKDRFPDRFAIFHVLSQEEQDLPILHGRLDQDRVRQLLKYMVPLPSVDHAFLCGPAAMSEELSQTLRELGLAPDKIHVERFVSQEGGRPKSSPIAPESMTLPAAHIASLIVDGKRHKVPVAEGEAVLDAALRAGMDLPFACKGGMCCTCRARLVEGKVNMNVNYSLEPWEIDAGFVLTCQARPATAEVTIDFDHQ